MLALSIALGTIILIAICVAIMTKMEDSSIESEKLTQEQYTKPLGQTGLNGSSAANQMTGADLIGNIAKVDEVLTTAPPKIFDAAFYGRVVNVSDDNWVAKRPLDNRTESILIKNTTIPENGGEEIIFDENGPKKLEATSRFNRATATGSLLGWPIITYTFIILRWI